MLGKQQSEHIGFPTEMASSEGVWKLPCKEVTHTRQGMVKRDTLITWSILEDALPFFSEGTFALEQVVMVAVLAGQDSALCSFAEGTWGLWS